MIDTRAKYLNFSWLIEDQIGASRGPIEAADLAYLRQQGIKALVRMSEGPLIRASEIKSQGIEDCHEPIPDLSAPFIEQIERMISFIEDCIARSKPVGVSCDGGYGRTGTILACYLVRKGFDPEEAINYVKVKRPGSMLTLDQKQALNKYALRIKGKISQTT